jgi:hypothetical protein
VPQVAIPVSGWRRRNSSVYSSVQARPAKSSATGRAEAVEDGRREVLDRDAVDLDAGLEVGAGGDQDAGGECR